MQDFKLSLSTTYFSQTNHAVPAYHARLIIKVISARLILRMVWPMAIDHSMIWP